MIFGRFISFIFFYCISIRASGFASLCGIPALYYGLSVRSGLSFFGRKLSILAKSYPFLAEGVLIPANGPLLPAVLKMNTGRGRMRVSGKSCFRHLCESRAKESGVAQTVPDCFVAPLPAGAFRTAPALPQDKRPAQTAGRRVRSLLFETFPVSPQSQCGIRYIIDLFAVNRIPAVAE